MNPKEFKVLNEIVKSKYVNCLYDIKLNPMLWGYMLYPTNDLWLTKKQFQVLKEFIKQIGEYEFCLAQFDGSSLKERENFQGLFSESNPVYYFSLDNDYSEYKNISLFSVSVLFSSRGNWAILLDETFDAGYGIFVSCKEYVEKFKELYHAIYTEYRQWMDDKRFEEDLKYYQSLLVTNGVINLFPQA